jgi:hypothetical protein
MLGAIMFGDSLLPAECRQLVSHLKRTSLCFQVCLPHALKYEVLSSSCKFLNLFSSEKIYRVFACLEMTTSKVG